MREEIKVYFKSGRIMTYRNEKLLIIKDNESGLLYIKTYTEIDTSYNTSGDGRFVGQVVIAVLNRDSVECIELTEGVE